MLSAGTSGQVLTSGGTSAPTWTTISTTAISNGTSTVNVTSASGPILANISGTTIANITSTGIAVTGTVSATGGITIGSGTGGSLTGLNNFTANNILSLNAIGYTIGSGGVITQGTSRTTAVTLNKSSGQIILFTAAGVTTPTSFTVSNSTVASTDTVIVNQATGTNYYATFVTAVASGSFRITFYSLSGTASDAPVFNFNVIKGVNA
jgi:hypothetical protein